MVKDKTFELSEETLKGLRGLRLYHWKKGMQHRREENEVQTHLAPVKAKGGVVRILESRADAARKLADFHFKQVFFLNDLFPAIGDTAEKDEYDETKSLARSQSV